ncbi:hypothetical protein ILYODFUR_038222 [Ilyodon furcidens]|uniref:Uncharacterized protein n=1 Tax=Ilyodon furcidens TaxID=33524 RepID=A0ABV0UPS1_9TELE
MKGWLANFPFHKFNIFVILVVSFSYNVLLEKDMLCTCDQVFADCLVYMAGPFLIIFFLMIWTDKTFMRACRFKFTCANKGENCRTPWTSFCGLLCYHSFKAFLVGLLWLVSVFIEGDWYVCCCNNGSEQSQLACKDTKKITTEEKKTIDQLKNTSKKIGFGVLLSIVVIVTVMSAFDWKKCCKCDRKQIYHKHILKETEEVLETTLREAAKNDLTERITVKINQDTWDTCFDVASDMIRSSCKPKLVQQPEPQQDQQLEQ